MGVKRAGPGDYIDKADRMPAAAETIRSHRHGIAPTYSELLAGAKYDPTKSKDLLYAQALNLENYLCLAVLGPGVVQIAPGAGAFMILTAIALFLVGPAFIKMPRPVK